MTETIPKKFENTSSVSSSHHWDLNFEITSLSHIEQNYIMWLDIDINFNKDSTLKTTKRKATMSKKKTLIAVVYSSNRKY